MCLWNRGRFIVLLPIVSQRRGNHLPWVVELPVRILAEEQSATPSASPGRPQLLGAVQAAQLTTIAGDKIDQVFFVS